MEVDVKAAPIHEGVDVIEEVLLVVFIMQPQQLLKRLRLEGTVYHQSLRLAGREA